MKAHGEVDAYTHVSLVLVLVGGKLVASYSGRFTPEKGDTGWVDPRAGVRGSNTSEYEQSTKQTNKLRGP
jgi:hypothetical protein